MLNLSKLAMWVAAIMIVAGLTIPHVCLADTSTASSHQISAEKHTDHSGKSKTADNCCAASHCCVAKVIGHTASIWISPSIGKMTMALPVMQNPLGHIPQGLERPPKSLV